MINYCLDRHAPIIIHIANAAHSSCIKRLDCVALYIARA